MFCSITALGIYLNQLSPKNSQRSWILRFAWVFIALWVLDLVLVPFRIVHPVPDPYQSAEVKAVAGRVKQLAGEGRLVSLKAEGQNYTSAVTNYSGSFQQTAERLTQNTNVVWGIKSAEGHLTTVVDGFQNLSQYLRKGFPYDGRVLDAAGVNTILTPKPLSAFKYQTLEPDAGLYLVHNAGAMRMEWETEREKVFGSRAESFGSLLNPKNFLEDESDFDLRPDGQISSLAPTSQYENPVANTPCEFQFAVSAGASKYFVLDQCFAPGWHAWVDGQPTPILRAEGLWMAVALGTMGSHQVSFQYSPISFRLGLFVTLIALAVFGFLGFKASSFNHRVNRVNGVRRK